MLLIDEVNLTEDDGQKASVASYHVRGDEYFLQGHFPQNPVVPGVILCEMMGQSSCALIMDAAKGSMPYFTGLNKVKFRQKVLPGDTIKFRSILLKSRPPFYFVKSEGYVGEKLCASGELSFALLKGGADSPQGEANSPQGEADSPQVV
jgi:3-hydroxyacyl-[acyl-carrier-protein] dehydratase